MKKIIFCVLLFAPLLFDSCSKTYTIDSENEPKNVPQIEYEVSDFCDLRKLCYKDCYWVWVDLKTDILYLTYDGGYRFGITPIMKPDGTCLTLSEWKEEKLK